MDADSDQGHASTTLSVIETHGLDRDLRWNASPTCPFGRWVLRSGPRRCGKTRIIRHAVAAIGFTEQFPYCDPAIVSRFRLVPFSPHQPDGESLDHSPPGNGLETRLGRPGCLELGIRSGGGELYPGEFAAHRHVPDPARPGMVPQYMHAYIQPQTELYPTVDWLAWASYSRPIHRVFPLFGRVRPEPDANAIFDPLYSVPAASAGDIKALKKHVVTDDAAGCCLICLADFDVGEEVIITPCGHTYHEPCIAPWLWKTATCPACRVNLKYADTPDLMTTRQEEQNVADESWQNRDVIQHRHDMDHWLSPGTTARGTYASEPADTTMGDDSDGTGPVMIILSGMY